MTSQKFTRTRFTIYAYAMMFVFGVAVAVGGPIVPFIGDQLDLTYTQRGLHFTGLALGNLSTGLFGDRIADWLGNRRTSQAGLVAVILGTSVLVWGFALPMTVSGTIVLGVGAGLLALVATASLADAHPDYQTRAITEGNISAGFGVALTPLIVGLLARYGIGWGSTPFFVGLLTLGALVVFWRVPFPTPRSQSATAQADGSGSRPLPPLYWMFGAVLFMTIAIEWVTISWTPDFLNTVRGFDRGTAAALGSGFAWAIVVGRLLGRWLLERMSDEQLMIGGYALVLVVFPVYAYAPGNVLSLLALVILGLVVANLFPLAMAAAMAAGAEQTNRASARISVFGGTATLILPQTVGALADIVGLQRAYGVIILLAAIAVGITVAAFRMRERNRAMSV